MGSIQDLLNSAQRVKVSSNEVQQRTAACADSLQQQAGRLATTVRGSNTGEDAVRQVREAERAVRECSTRLLKLQSDIDRFMRDLAK